jgi:hypothetical protein
VEKLQAYYEPVKKMMENLYTYVPTLLANFNNHPALVLAWQEIQLIYFLLQNTLFDLKIIHSFNPQHFLAGLAIIIQNLEQFQNHYAFHNKQSFIINNLLMCAFAIQKKCLQKQQNQNLGFLDKTLLSQIGKAELSVHFYAALRDPRNLQADEIILGSWLEQLLQLLHPDSTTEEASTSLFDNALASSRTNFGTK